MPHFRCNGTSCIGPDDLDLEVSFDLETSPGAHDEPPWSEVTNLEYVLDGTPVFRSELATRFGLDVTDEAISAAIENAGEYYDD